MLRTLHVCRLDKVIPPFIDFVREKVGSNNQFFLSVGDIEKFSYREAEDSKHLVGFFKYLKMAFYMNCSEKIILHGLLGREIVLVLFLQPWLLKKCYWIMWGADLYSYRKPTRTYKTRVLRYMQGVVFKNVGYLVTGTDGDFQLAKEVYKSKGKFIKCFNYPSNLYKPFNIIKTDKNDLVFQVGNSGDPTNEHEAAFKLLDLSQMPNYFKVYCPLSYGDNHYIDLISKKGQQSFGKKFNPVKEFLSLDKYVQQLARVDVAIFAHKRQQAFGNIITLLGLGKTVYLDKSNTLYSLLNNMGIKVHDIEQFQPIRQTTLISERNIDVVKREFSEDSLINSLRKWIL